MAFYATLKALHILSLMVWMGGMFFAHVCLRPAAMVLPPPTRLPLMRDVLQRFFAAVMVAASLAVISGFWMVFRTAGATRQTGAPFNTPLEWWLMGCLGLMMVLIFVYIRFALFPRLASGVDAHDWPVAGAALQSIRRWVVVNLTIGTAIVLITFLGELG